MEFARVGLIVQLYFRMFFESVTPVIKLGHILKLQAIV